ncbi:gamma-glutamyltransferase [Cytobacillus sp. FSL R5-0569]|uniref:gamma-glutamyltransferase family protein n=1 Tax=Cytobacillus sp. FSL R5-0569 TaxID=2921649 RepID=UPI0030F6FDA2
MKKKLILLGLLVVILIVIVLLRVFDGKGEEEVSLPMIGTESGEYGVSASHPLAVKVGMEVLNEGGNAVDAAVAVSYALAVVEPYGSGLGGGGETLVYQEGAKPFVQQYREMAPLSSEEVESDSGIPGFVKGMEDIHEAEGSMSFKKIMDKVIPLAADGFEVDEDLSYRFKVALKNRIDEDEDSPFIIDGEPIEPGDRLVQPALAETLKNIRDGGAAAFYRGEMAESFAEQHDSFDRSDFSKYTSQKMKAVQGEFMGYDVFSSAPPYSGLTVIQSLQMAEKVLEEQEWEDEPSFVASFGEISKIAYEQRLSQIGDMDYTDLDLEKSMSKEFTDELVEEHKDIFKSARLNDSEAERKDYGHTTHFVVVDDNGMMVSTTNSLGNFFGTGEYMEEGFFLNNALTNYSENEKSPNVFEPGKRPRSFISPTILANDKEVIGIGSPGGRRIPAVVTESILYHLVYGYSLQQAVERPRFYLEDDKIEIEPGFKRETYNELQSKGYKVKINDNATYFGSVNALSLQLNDRTLDGAADPRRIGEWKKAE